MVGRKGVLCCVDTGYSLKKCKIISSTQAYWMMIRVSGDFAASLLRDLDPTGSAIGHHEAIVGAYSKIHNFTVQEIPREYIGRAMRGGWGKWIELPPNQTSRLEHHGPIHHNKLYHGYHKHKGLRSSQSTSLNTSKTLHVSHNTQPLSRFQLSRPPPRASFDPCEESLVPQTE